jgi:hypothetical protein
VHVNLWRTYQFTALSTFSSTGGGMTLSPGFTYYWTLGSCQVYMNNNLQPARDIYYCFDYTNRTSSPPCYIYALTPRLKSSRRH